MPRTIAVAMPRKKYGPTSFGERLQNIRKTRGLTQVQLAEAGFPPAPAVIGLAKALDVTTDELLGVKPPKVERIDDDSEARRMWKRFQMVAVLPERARKPSSA